MKWWRHTSASREAHSSSMNPKTSPDVELKVPPTQNAYHQPLTAQPIPVSKKQGFLGPLGLGEYVESFGGVFEETEVTGGSPQPGQRSRSLIDISMPHLWGDVDVAEDEEERVGEGGLCENDFDARLNSGSEGSRRNSVSSDKRPPGLLATVARFFPVSQTAPNLVQFLDSPMTSASVYESMETNFFGNPEERWSMPAVLVTTCPNINNGDVFNAHCVADYMAELKLAANWARSVKCLCEGDLRKYKSAGRRNRQRLLAVGKSDKETSLKDLHADFTTFLEELDNFVEQTKEKSGNAPLSAVLVACHHERLSSLCSLLPVPLSPSYLATSTESHKIVHRQLISEAVVTTVLSQEANTEVCAFLLNDSIILATCQGSKASSTSPSIAGCLKGTVTFKTLTRLALSFLGACIDPLPKETTHYPCSSSSGVSSTTSADWEEMEPSENFSTSGCEDRALGISFWWPIDNQCHLSFTDPKYFSNWSLCLQNAMDSVQGSYANEILRVKVQNEITPGNASEICKCVHKYIAIGPDILVHQLKGKAVTAWNIASRIADVEAFAVFRDPVKGPVEIPLSDEARPFLLVLYVDGLHVDTWSPPSEQTPRQHIFAVSPDQIPVTFIIRDSAFEATKIPIDQALFEPSPSLAERPKSTFCPEVARNPRPFISHSYFNINSSDLKDESKVKGGILSGKVHSRSRSRLRLYFSRSVNDDDEDDTDGDADDNDDEAGSAKMGIFGRLPKDAWPDCRVPMSVMSLFVVVFYEGSLVEGIFRKSVLASHLQAMSNRVDTDEYPLMANECSPLCCAAILKKYFSDIPGHLLIDEKWDDWCKIVTFKSDEEIASYAKKMMRELPDINQSLLTFLLFTLAQIRLNQDTNKMSVDALATVWAPNLLERPRVLPSVEDSKICTNIVACLLGPFTNTYCLKSSEFRQNLSCFFEDIWSQMNPPGLDRHLPKGFSILELQSSNDRCFSDKAKEEIPSGIHLDVSKSPNSASTPREGPSSLRATPETSTRLKRNAFKATKIDFRYSRSQDSSDIPPPIPPRIRQKGGSTSLNLAADVSPVLMIPPTIPPRPTYSTPLTFYSKKSIVISKDNGSVPGTTVVDRRRSLLRRQHTSRSPERSTTVGVVDPSKRPFMIGDNFSPDTNSSSPPSVESSSDGGSSHHPIQRSSSDIDEFLQSKMLTIPCSRRQVNQSEFPCLLEKRNPTPEKPFFWQTTEPRRKKNSVNRRCETRWTCDLYTNDTNTVEEEEVVEDLPVESGKTNVTLIARPQLQAPRFFDSKATVLLRGPTVDDLSGGCSWRLPDVTAEVPQGICRRMSSIYEQKRSGGCGVVKTLSLRGVASGPEQLILGNSGGGSTHLSRGSSYASTGSSTSTVLGPSL